MQYRPDIQLHVEINIVFPCYRMQADFKPVDLLVEVSGKQREELQG